MGNVLLASDIPAMARMLDDSVGGKKMTAPGISTDRIDRLYDITFVSAALTGKVAGAVGGRFVMFLARSEDRPELLRALNTAGGSPGSIKFA
jgi:galactokinase/mevalonate kinase-like predicted kinase